MLDWILRTLEALTILTQPFELLRLIGVGRRRAGIDEDQIRRRVAAAQRRIDELDPQSATAASTRPDPPPTS